jgi:predicted TIM-barrel fold metal-dependent hydrolase
VIIDMRCRLTTKEAGKYFYASMAKAGRLAEVPALVEGTIDAFFKEIGEAGVTTAVSVSGNSPGLRRGDKVLMPDRTTSNDLLAEVQKAYYGKFIGVAGIDVSNTFHNALDEIERCVKGLGLKAVFIEPGRYPGWPLTDPHLYPIYQKCQDLNVPIIPQTGGPIGVRYIDLANPKYVDEVAYDFPDLTIICGHACTPYVREMIAVAGKRENVYPSPDLSLFRPGTQDWIDVVNENWSGLADKFLFGSAYPLISIKSYTTRFFKLPWKEEILDKILYKNALRALKLETDPVFKKMYKI